MNPNATEEEIDGLFRSYRATKRRRIRNELVELHIGFAYHVADRFKNRGVDRDDLRQIALLGLVKAVDRFDPDHGAAFTSFAGRTVEGEIKRHFRDATWTVRVPRSAKELHLLVRRANDELETKLSRSPTVKEVAAHLEIEADEVVQALAVSAAFSPASLDQSATDDDGGTDRSSRLASHDADLEDTADRVMVERLLDSLDDRERRIIELRFYEGRTQTEIADEVGVSQMHVSRLIRRSLAAMRDQSGAISSGRP